MGSIVHFEIPANDVNKLKAFYEKAFGWKIVHAPAGGMDYWVIHTVPTDEKGMLLEQGVNGGMYHKRGENNLPVNYVSVENIDKSVKAAEKLGASVVSGKQEIPGVGFFAVVCDPEGNQIAMLQTKLM
jgi:predicted enzyme related to lactoylglutathione lyase